MDCIFRINLKTATEYREELVNFCLNSNQQYLAIGWSRVYEEGETLSFSEYYERIRKDSRRINPVLNIFKNSRVNDLFWTRDLEGNYWICRVTDSIVMKYDYRLDYGALLPIEAYKFGMQVPGQIKAAFNRANAGTAQRIRDIVIVEYSKAMYNKLSGRNQYRVEPLEGSLLDNLPDFDLEELVISYIQLKYNYYVLSNSIANKSTTMKIECEFLSRDPNKKSKAVVQVKGRKAEPLDARQFRGYVKDGYRVFLYAPCVLHAEEIGDIVIIDSEDILTFYEEYKSILPISITQWETLF